MKLGYFKQFIALFGIRHGVKLYFDITFGRLERIILPNVLHPISLRKNTTDLKVFYQIFINGEYDIALKSEPKIIIDGGANIGLFSILMSNKFPDSKIIAVEPEIGNYIQLCKNVKNYENIVCLQKAIWHKTTRLKINNNNCNGEWGFVVSEEPNGEIDAISITDIIKEFDFQEIDILKLDIESSEKEVFEHNVEVWLSKCQLIIVELHDWIKKGSSKSFFNALNSQIASYEYSISGENTVIYILNK